MRRKTEPLKFNPYAWPLSLGVESELQVLDVTTLQLSPRAADIINVLGKGKFKKEFFQSTLEVVTGICNSVQMVEADLRDSLHRVIQAAKTLNLKP
jgi:carboxylate-amine ligase